MKRILFDHQIFRKQPYGGISHYFTELITGLRGHKEYTVLPKKFYSENVNLAKNNLTRLNKFRQTSFPGKQNVEKMILKQEELATLDILQTGRFDVFHPTYYNPYFLDHMPGRKPLVLTVHDMIHENYYDHHYEYLMEETLWKRKLIPRANHIIAVSQYTKDQILKYYPSVEESNISVVHHGIDASPYTGETNLKLPEKYILYVGIRKHYKNFPWLAHALAGYLKQNNITLLCAGGNDFDAYEKDILNGLNAEGLIKYFPVNTAQDMAALYSNALCFVFPSLAEGFGIPVLEAFANNCPVLLVNSSCFPEIAGDAALYFEPGDGAGLVNQLDSIITQTAVSDELVENGSARVKQYTWEGSVEKHMEIYNNLAG